MGNVVPINDTEISRIHVPVVEVSVDAAVISGVDQYRQQGLLPPLFLHKLLWPSGGPLCNFMQIENRPKTDTSAL